MTATLLFTLPEEQEDAGLTAAGRRSTVSMWEPAAHGGLFDILDSGFGHPYSASIQASRSPAGVGVAELV
jgi:hypothetical protein